MPLWRQWAEKASRLSGQMADDVFCLAPGARHLETQSAGAGFDLLYPDFWELLLAGLIYCRIDGLRRPALD